ncbi:MAG TPA: MmcQ/YjbR family DNA-binding protein [Nocardioides sp.]
MAKRPEVPQEMIARLRAICESLPECVEQDAWVGVRWQVHKASVVHVFGGEDQQFRVVLRAEPDEVMAFEHLGHPYFRTEWGANTVGMIVEEQTDWDEVAELVIDSYCLQAPRHLSDAIERPDRPDVTG